MTESRQTRTRLQHLLTVSPAVLYSRQPQGSYAITFISTNIQTHLGYSPQDFLEDPSFWINHIHSQDREQVLAKLQMISQHDTLCYEYRFRHRDGRYRWMRDAQRLVRDSNGRPLEIVGSWFDITERKQIEEAYRQNQGFLQTLLDHLPVMIAYFNPQGRLQWINQELEQCLRWPLEELKQEELKQKDSLAAFYPNPVYRQQVRAFTQQARSH